PAPWARGPLAPGETGERLLGLTVADLGAGDPLVRPAHATISSGAAAATASVVTMVHESPLALVMVANPDPVNPGQFVTYELTVTNRRPEDAVQVQITMPIPSGVSGCGRVSDGGQLPNGCFTGYNTVWTLDSLPAGTSRTVQTVHDIPNLADGTIIRAAAAVADAAGSRS